MTLPEIEILDEGSGDYKGSKFRIPIKRRATCSSCEQVVERERKDDVSRILPHNRRVFHRMKNGHPDWVIEACPGGTV